MMDAATSAAAATASSSDDALNEAMSMLDSLSAQENNNNNGGNLHNNRTNNNNNNNNDRSASNTGFAIDSDDDDDDDDFNLDELNDELLEGIDLNEGGGSSNNNDDVAAKAVEGAAAAVNDNTTAAFNNNNSEMMKKKEEDPPQNDVAVNSSSLSLEKSAANNNLNSNKATSTTTFVHPLQDMGTSNTAANHNSNDSKNNNVRQSSWTTNLSTNLASFAKVASASLQSAVESAEDMLIHQGEPTQQLSGVGGSFAHHGVTHAANNSNIASATSGGGVSAIGGGQQKAAISSSASAAAPMTYQERQRLLHQQYHAANNNTNAVGGNNNNNTAAVNMGGVAAATMSSSQPNSMSPMKKAVAATTSSSSTFTSPTRGATTTTPRASPITNNSTTPTPTTAASVNQDSITSTTTSSPTFLDKLTTNLDTQTKNALILQALKDSSSSSSNNTNNNANNNTEVLLPGERIIMFINNLRDVQDSRYGHIFVGSDEVGMSVCMRDCLDGKMMLMEDVDVAAGAAGAAGGGAGSMMNATTTTIWCCVMTFYRIILFSYQVGSEDGRVLLDGSNNIDGEEEGGGGGGGKKNEIVEQWLKSRNVSVQFQAAHRSHPSLKNNRKKHHVFQMPLASIERVEKVLSSSQSSLSNTSMNSGSNITGGGSSYTNNYLPSSNSAVSSASSAMSQLGNQMKPLTGLVAGIAAANAGVGGGSGGGGSGNNLLTNGTNSGVSSSPSSGSGASGPLGIIIHGKDGGRWIRFSTSSYTDATRAHEALNTYAFPGRRNLGYLFAFESRRTEVMASSGGGGTQQMGGGGGEGGGNPIATATPPTRRRFVAMEEFSRQGIVKGGGPVGGVTHSTPWTVIHANAKNYGLCSTYPSVLVVPRSIVGSDDGNNLDSGGMGILRRCAAFRSENRFPVLTWGNSEHGGSIWRSSQPKVGLQGYRSSEDERYLYAIGEEAKRANLAADARADGGVGSGSSHRPPIEFLRMLCGRNNESDLIMEGSNSSCMLKIMDMRPKSAAMANRTQGYGYENTNYYRGSTINFYGIGNIHAVRDAYQKVNALCLNPNTSDIQWMQLVENTNWPSMTRLILSASWQTAFHVHYNRLPILLHCSHGWDRTSQVSALAQLLLDPHYRTREGFSTLVEKDFLSFGHPFHTRSGHGEGKNEQGGDEGQLSPIFLQFLDCVFQLVNQFPNYFEFNARYLLLLSENIYSCRFGTLLCDSEREREVVAGIRQRTYCMWDHLDSISELVNPLFDKAANADAGVLMMPLPMLLRNVTLWTDRLCMYGAKATIPCMPTVGSEMDRMITNLHTSVDETTGSLQRAIADSHMWKETALTALKEVEELRMKLSEKNE